MNEWFARVCHLLQRLLTCHQTLLYGVKSLEFLPKIFSEKLFFINVLYYLPHGVPKKVLSSSLNSNVGCFISNKTQKIS